MSDVMAISEHLVMAIWPLFSGLCSLTSDLRCLYSSTSRTAGEFILSSDAYFPDHRSCVSTSFMLKFAHSVIVRATQQLASLSR